MVWANVTEMGGWNISKTPYAPEKWTFFQGAPGSGEADLPPEALEKQTFLWRLQRNRPSSRASGETDFPLEPLENILQAMFSTLSAPGCSGGKPASPEPDLRAGLQ